MTNEQTTRAMPESLILICLGPCHGEFYLPLDEDAQQLVCPNDRDHLVAVYRLIIVGVQHGAGPVAGAAEGGAVSGAHRERGRATRWKAMRFVCPRAGCTQALELADHGRRDPSTVGPGHCPAHRDALMAFDSEWPLYEEEARR